MSRPQGPDGGPLFPCPSCGKLARRVQRRRWTRNRLLAPLIVGLVSGVAFAAVTGAVAFGVLVGLMVAAIGFALAPDTFLNLECDNCGYEEEVRQ